MEPKVMNEHCRAMRLSTATLFLFHDLVWKQDDGYDQRIAYIAGIIRSYGYSDINKISSCVTDFINPTDLEHSIDHLVHHRKICTLYTHGKGVSNEGDLKKIGIEKPVTATLCYSFAVPGRELNNRVQPFTYGELADRALLFADLGIDFMLTEYKAGIQQDKIFMSKHIFELLTKSGHEQTKHIYVPK